MVIIDIFDPENALPLRVVRLSGSSIDRRFVHPEKASKSIVCKLLGNTIRVILEQFINEQ